MAKAAIVVLLWSATTTLCRAQDTELPEARVGLSAFPVVAYLPETGVVLGGYGVRTHRMANQDLSVPASALPVLLAVTTGGELGFEFTPSLYLGAEGRWWLTVDLTGRIRNGAQYYGLGNGTDAGDEETHRQRLVSADTRVLHQLLGQLFVGAVTRLQWQVIDRLPMDSRLRRQPLPGLGGNALVGLGPSVVYDSRNTVRGPDTGWLLEWSLPIHTGWLGSDHNFTRLRLDARRYLRLHAEHTLAVRVLSEWTLGTPPLTELPGVAGSNSLRGFIRGRYRDRQMLSAEIEYRFPIHGRLRGALFVGAGQVARRHTDFGLDRFHAAAGFGIRYAVDREERIRMRFDLAVSEEGRVRPYFAPLEAF